MSPVSPTGPSTSSVAGAPRVPRQVVPRTRLHHRLDAGGALTVVRGPAGSGKTTAIADWAASRGAGPGVWLTVDESTTARSDFWRAVLESLLDAALVDAPVVDRALHGVRHDETARGALCAALTTVRDAVIVIDSFELVDGSEVADDLLWVLERCPSIRAVVATRSLGPLESPGAALVLHPTVVLFDELAMTLDETEQLLDGLGLAPSTASDLLTATGGLPLAVRLGAVALRSDPERFTTARRDEFVDRLGRWLRDLLAEDALRPRLFEFVVRTAVPPMLTAELAAELSGSDDAADLLQAAEHEGLGMWSTGRHGTVFRYMPLVRATFVAEAQARIPDECERLWRAAARWCAEHGDGYTAARLALEIQDYDGASRYVRGVWLADSAPTPAFWAELGKTPRRRLRKHPILLMVMALKYNASRVHRLRALETFGLAIMAMRAAGPSVELGERVTFLASEIAAYRVSGRIKPALAAAEKAWTILSELGPYEVDELGDACVLAWVHTGITFFHAGDTGRAIHAVERAYSNGAGRTSRTVFHSLALIAGLRALLGEMREAAAAVAAIDEGGWPERWRHGYEGALYNVARAFLALERHDLEEAQSAVDVMAPHLATVEHWPIFEYLQSTIDLGRGNAAARLVLVESRREERNRPAVGEHLRAWLDAGRAQLRLATGRAGDVEGIARRGGRGRGMVIALHALRELLKDDPQSALEHANDVLARTDESVRVRVQVLAIAASASRRLRRDDLAVVFVTQLGTLMREHGLGLALMMLPRPDRAALQALDEELANPGRPPALGDLSSIPSPMRAIEPAIELSERERVVLRTLVRTGSAAQIAAELFVSPNTVKTQLRSVYRKLGVGSREEALLAAAARGLLADPAVDSSDGEAPGRGASM